MMEEEQVEEKSRGFLDRSIEKVVDIVYSKDKKIQRWFIVLLIVGFVLRLIAALNLEALPDDMIKASQAIGIWDARVLSTSSHPALFYYLSDLAGKVFGYTTLASRFWPLVFGTLIIIVTFLIAKKLFNERVALASAFLVTFSSLMIRTTIAEESLLIFFFAFLGIYLGLEYLDTRKRFFLFGAGISFGLASLSKYSAGFFLFAFVVFVIVQLYRNNEKILSKRNVKALIIIMILFFVFSLPFLTFNYLLNKDKGITDIYFSRIFPTENSQQLYGGLGGQETSFFENLFNPYIYRNVFLFLKIDHVIMWLGIFGLIFLFMRKRYKPFLFVLILLLIPFVLQSAGSGLVKHFLFMPLLLAIPGGYLLVHILKKIDSKGLRIFLIILLLSVLIWNLGNGHGTPPSYVSQSGTSQLKAYLDDNVESGDLIVFDSRIYTAKTFWLGAPNHLLNIISFANFFNQNLELSEQQKTPVDVYFVECAIDDCGWGTVHSQNEFNNSVEELFGQLTQNNAALAEFEETQYEGNEFFGEKEKKVVYKVYRESILLNAEAVEQTDLMNSFYFAPYLYKNIDSFIFNYKIESGFGRFLENLSYYIILLSMFLSGLIVVWILWFVIYKL